MEVDRKLFFLLFFFCYKFVGTSCSPVAPQRTDPSFLFIIRIHHFLLEKNSMFPPCSFPFIFEETQAHKTKTEEQSKAHSALIWQRGKGTKTAFIVENSAWSFPPIKKKNKPRWHLLEILGVSGSRIPLQVWKSSPARAVMEQGLIPTWRRGSGAATAPGQQFQELPQGFECQIRIKIVLGWEDLELLAWRVPWDEEDLLRGGKF